MSSSDEGLVKLRRLLSTEAKVADEVVQYILETLGCQSVSDLAGVWTEKTYQEGVVSQCLDLTSLKGNLVQTSRLRLAWELARSELSGALKRKSDAVDHVDDMDLPLDADLCKDIELGFHKRHSFKLPAESIPSTSLFGRIYREFRKQSLTVHSLDKVRSSAFNQIIMPQRRLALGGGLQVTFEGRESELSSNLASPLQVLQALHVLLSGYALCGTTLKPSKRSSGNVPDADLTSLCAYHSFVYQRALAHPGPSAAAVQWLLDRDLRTRSHARELFSDGWPYGEALLEVIEKKMSVLWEITAGQPREILTPVQQAVVQQAQGGSPAKRAKPDPVGESQFTLAELCTAWNDHRGCTNRQRDCPLKLLHRCNNMVDDKLCGSWQHNRLKCGQSSSKGAGKPSSGGKGGGKAKGKGGKKGK